MPSATLNEGVHKMSTLAIEKVDVPTINRPGREKTPNPFAETVKSLKLTTKDTKGEAAAVKVANADVAKTVRKMQDAGREVGVSVRTLVSKAGEQHSKITFWPVPAITHKKAEGETKDETATANAKAATSKPKK